MQKLLGTSSGKNNKSCRIFHNESNKIGFAFFWFFCDFLRILQESVKWLYYLRFTFARRSLETFGILQICPYFAAEPLEITGDSQCGPWGRPAEVPAEIRRAGGAGQPGKVGRRTRDPPATCLGAWLESGSSRRGRTAVATVASRCAPRSGEVAAGEKKWSGSAASVGARGGGGYRSWAMRSAGTWVHHGDLYWRRWAAQAGWQGVAECRDGRRLDTRSTGRQTLYRRRAPQLRRQAHAWHGRRRQTCRGHDARWLGARGPQGTQPRGAASGWSVWEREPELQRGARARDARRCGAVQNMSVCLCLTAFFSESVNRSAQSGR
jgi:hypothetical protein